MKLSGTGYLMCMGIFNNYRNYNKRTIPLWALQWEKNDLIIFYFFQSDVFSMIQERWKKLVLDFVYVVLYFLFDMRVIGYTSYFRHVCGIPKCTILRYLENLNITANAIIEVMVTISRERFTENYTTILYTGMLFHRRLCRSNWHLNLMSFCKNQQ